MNPQEKILKGGWSTEEVVRIGPTVRRTQSPNSEYVHNVLDLLAETGFAYAPKFLGIDEKGREILTYLEGEVPRDTTLSLDQIIDAIGMLRSFHDSTTGSPLSAKHEVIYHNDFAPWNILVDSAGKITGVIDFDEAAPGKRIDDVAYFIWTFLELGSGNEPTGNQIRNTAELVKAYGLRERELLVPALISQQYRILKKRQWLALNEDDPEARAFSQGAVVRIKASINWVLSKQELLNAALLNNGK